MYAKAAYVATKKEEKIYITPPTMENGLLNTPNYEIVCSAPELCKTGYITPETVSHGSSLQ